MYVDFEAESLDALKDHMDDDDLFYASLARGWGHMAAALSAAYRSVYQAAIS